MGNHESFNQGEKREHHPGELTEPLQDFAPPAPYEPYPSISQYGYHPYYEQPPTEEAEASQYWRFPPYYPPFYRPFYPPYPPYWRPYPPFRPPFRPFPFPYPFQRPYR